ncbi:hypothetical protein Tco_1504284 [Tanacetum coccineum]
MAKTGLFRPRPVEDPAILVKTLLDPAIPAMTRLDPFKTRIFRSRSGQDRLFRPSPGQDPAIPAKTQLDPAIPVKTGYSGQDPDKSGQNPDRPGLDGAILVKTRPRPGLINQLRGHGVKMELASKSSRDSIETKISYHPDQLEIPFYDKVIEHHMYQH